jgi:ribosomal protein S18 acetylase RimI-like enzyme
MSDPLFVVRNFQPEDADAVVALWDECGLIRPWNNPHRDILRKLADRNGAFWVAASADDVADDVANDVIASVMIGYDGHRGSINYLAVAAAWQRTGIGAHLMRQAEAFLVDQGCPKINLCVRKDNEAVCAFYNQLGYAVDDVHLFGKRLIPDD